MNYNLEPVSSYQAIEKNNIEDCQAQHANLQNLKIVNQGWEALSKTRSYLVCVLRTVDILLR